MSLRLTKLKEGLEFHVVDTTALLVSTNPMYSAMEVGLAGMSDQVSIDSRLTVAALSYGGMGFAFAKGRDISRKIFSITSKTRERVQAVHDAIYSAAFGLAVCPFVYLGMGAEPKQAIIGGVSAAGMNVVLGPIMGYAIDTTRDLVGLQDCNRASYPNVVKRQKGSVKKGLAGLLLAGSIALMAGIYSLTPTADDNVQQPNSQVIETENK